MQAVWGKGLSEEMNITLAFALDLGAKTKGWLKIAGANCYKLYADGVLVGFGPQRAAHGYARVGEYSFSGRVLVVEAESCFVQNYCWIKQPPFFACEGKTEDGRTFSAADFQCYRLTDRVQKVPRYSFQRGFAEIYRMKEDRFDLYCGESRFMPIETSETSIPAILDSLVDDAKLTRHRPVKCAENGRVEIDETAEVWRDRAHTMVGGLLEGFRIEDWKESATDEASKFAYVAGESAAKGGLAYATYDFGRAITGFTELEIRARNPGSVYVIFDELLWTERGKGENYVGFERNTCASVHKWTLAKAGTFRVSTFEPYTVRYACVVYTEGMEVKIYQRDYENPHADRLRFSSSDARIDGIIEAARATLAQNSVDILTDCPSRERAGWLSDSWFSSVAEGLFTGDNAAERAFLENYLLADKAGLPEGMVPMCYPADDLDGNFIPNWAMWYILEIAKYAKRYGKDELVERSRKNVEGVLGYFKNKENELGLLENLDGWVFVEWSAANDAEHIKGVNVPSNIAYAACLEAAGKLYGDETLARRAEEVRAKIKELAYDGRFFVDNLVRNDSGALVRTNYLTEVCQYYAFWFDCAKPEEYPELFEELMERLGTNRAEGYLPEMAKPNAMYGTYMRIDLLMRMGERKRVLDECLRCFGKMAERTGTLWEHNGIEASCDHGFASYAARWIIWALTGYDALTGEGPAKEGIGVDCAVSLPLDKTGAKRLRIRVKENKVQVFRPLAHLKKSAAAD